MEVAWNKPVNAFFCLVLLALTVPAQPRGYMPEPIKPGVVVAVSPNGNIIAVGRSNNGPSRRYGRVELWRTRTGELLRSITGFDGPVWSVGFSRDGKTLITASTEYRDTKIQSIRDRDEKTAGELKWWNTETGEFIKKVSLAPERVMSLEAAWSPAGDVMAVVERRSRLQLTEVGEPGAYGRRTMITTTTSLEETELKLLDVQTGERTIKLEDAIKTYRPFLSRLFIRVDHPVFSPDGTKLAALAAEDVKIWDVRTGKKVLTLNKLKGWPTALAFSEDGRTLAVSTMKGKMPGGESEISLWQVATGKSVNKLKGRNDSIESLQFAAHGRALLIGSLEYKTDHTVGTVKMWDLRDNRLGKFDVHADEAISSLTLIPGEGAVVLQSGSDVELRDAKTFAVRYAFEPAEADNNESTRHSRFVLTAKRALAVAFSADGTTVSAEIPGEGIRVWDVRTGELKNRVPRQDSSDSPLITSTNGGLIAEVDTQVQTAQIKLSDASTKKLIRTIDAGQKITAVALDATGQLLAAARADFSIGVWDLKTGSLRVELRKNQDTINALAFSPDGQTLASGGDDRAAILWDLPTGKSKRTMKGHDVTVTSLAFSPDGETLATGSGNAAVVLWNVATGKLDRILR